jgi:DNA-binding CsgD family transcriptional regulator
MDAWFDGAFERCLELCDLVRARDAESRTHVGLTRARALLRLDRPDEALRALDDIAPIPCGTDEALTLRMLRGACRVRRSELDDGLRELLAARSDAASAHPTIRAEINVNIALAHMGQRDLAAAERALSLVSADADIVSARAIEYRAWIASLRHDTERAAALFGAALQAYDLCRHRDRFLEANCTRQLAHLAVETLDLNRWAAVANRRTRIDWEASGLAEPRFWIAYCASILASEVVGEPLFAAREARLAESIAPSEAYRVQALCRRAAVANAVREPVSRRDHVDAAAELCSRLDDEAFARDQRSALYVLAFELARVGDAERAAKLLQRGTEGARTARPQTIDKLSHQTAFRTLVEAAVREAEGDGDAAAQAYREAFHAFDAIGYRLRAVLAALAVVNLTGDRQMRAYAERATAHLSATSRLRAQVDAAKHPRLQLTDVQREVLALICQGKSNPEIARVRKRSLHTIRNLVARLFEVLDVSSREELAIEGVRLGVYTPPPRAEAS